MDDAALHHVSLPVADLARSRRFYAEVLGFGEIERPPLDFPGAWFRIGAAQLHLIECEGRTLRGDRGLDNADVHFAVRVPSFRAALESLRALGYAEDAADPKRMRVDLGPSGGVPQIYILDPDRHQVEINAAQLDL